MTIGHLQKPGLVIIYEVRWNGNWNRITWVIGGVIVVWRQMRVSGVTTEAFLTINGRIASAQVHVVVSVRIMRVVWVM